MCGSFSASLNQKGRGSCQSTSRHCSDSWGFKGSTALENGVCLLNLPEENNSQTLPIYPRTSTDIYLYRTCIPQPSRRTSDLQISPFQRCGAACRPGSSAPGLRPPNAVLLPGWRGCSAPTPPKRLAQPRPPVRRYRPSIRRRRTRQYTGDELSKLLTSAGNTQLPDLYVLYRTLYLGHCVVALIELRHLMLTFIRKGGKKGHGSLNMPTG